MNSAVSQESLDAAVVRRTDPLFAADVSLRLASIQDVLRGARVLVVGGAGSIGGATLAAVSLLRPAALHVVDLSENYLADLVRDLRGRAEGLPVDDFRALPLDYGSGLMDAYLAASKPFDIVLNFAALKHVRSEKEIFSLLRMIDVNVVRQARFKAALSRYSHGRRYFAVSTDKAANPTSLMGASKRLMEDVMFDLHVSADQIVTSARFANVAFSNGSILSAFLQRIQQKQPVAVPRDTSRYFVTRHESAHICMLAAFTAPNCSVVFPKLNSADALQDLAGIAERVIAAHGLKPVVYEDEEAARRDVHALAATGRWPMLLTPLNTSGEKPYEEFLGADETEFDLDYKTLGALRHSASGPHVARTVETLAKMVERPDPTLTKADVVSLIAQAVPQLRHIETGRSLDDRL